MVEILKPSGLFSLIDHFGRAVSERDFHGRFALVFFGFTRCRVVCPRALSKIAEALAMLGAQADHIAPLYITVDPLRDDPATMRDFLSRWPGVLGLTGSETQIEAAKQAFLVFARKAPGEGDAYEVKHSAFTHLLGPDGAHLDHWGDHLDSAMIAARLRTRLSIV